MVESFIVVLSKGSRFRHCLCAVNLTVVDQIFGVNCCFLTVDRSSSMIPHPLIYLTSFGVFGLGDFLEQLKFCSAVFATHWQTFVSY